MSEEGKPPAPPENKPSGPPPPESAAPAGPKPAPVKPAAPAAKPATAAAATAAKPAAAAAKPAAPPKPKGPAPVDASGKPIVQELTKAVPGAVVSATEFFGELSIEVTGAKLVEACRYLKEDQKFDYLVDLTAVDWRDKTPRFEIVYWLHSFPKNSERMRLRCRVTEGMECPTVSGVWKTANWMEREVFDMFGVRFAEHPDMRRILTWDGFQGHPLRKDFPIEGVDTGAAIYPDRYPDGGGPAAGDSNRKVIS